MTVQWTPDLGLGSLKPGGASMLSASWGFWGFLGFNTGWFRGFRSFVAVPPYKKEAGGGGGGVGASGRRDDVGGRDQVFEEGRGGTYAHTSRYIHIYTHCL